MGNTSDCLFLSSLGLESSLAPKFVPLGNESGKWPSLKCASKVTGSEGVASESLAPHEAFGYQICPHAPVCLQRRPYV